MGLAPWPDGLSLNGLLWHLHLGWLPWWVGIAAAGTFLIYAASRRDHTWGNAISLGATMTLVTFVTAKWAFFNYYFIVAMGFILALTWLGTSANSVLQPTSGTAHKTSPAVASTALP